MENNKDVERLSKREMQKEEKSSKNNTSKKIIKDSLRRQMTVIITVLLVISLIASIRYVLNFKTIEKVDSLSDAISKTGKVADADFITIDDETKTYKIDLDKAYEELQQWAKKQSINLNDIGLTKELYGEILKTEASNSLIDLGGRAEGVDYVQGKIKVYRITEDGQKIEMTYDIPKTFYGKTTEQEIETIQKVGIGASKVSTTDDMSTDESTKIWNILREEGWNEIAIAGAIGNMYVESRYQTNALEIAAQSHLGTTQEEFTNNVNSKYISKEEFVKCPKYPNAGYGLIQWSTEAGRKGLYEATRDQGIPIDDRQGQLKYLTQYANQSEKMKNYIKGIDSKGREITEVNYAAVLFYEMFERGNLNYEENPTSEEARQQNQLEVRAKAAQEVYKTNGRIKVGLNIKGYNNINNKFSNIKNISKVADNTSFKVTDKYGSNSYVAKSQEDVKKLEDYYDDEVYTHYTVQDGNLVVGNLSIVQYEILESDFAAEEHQGNRLLDDGEDGNISTEGETIKETDRTNINYAMTIDSQSINFKDNNALSGMSAKNTVALMLSSQETDNNNEKVFNVKDLLQEAQKQEGSELGVYDFIVKKVTTQTETMDITFKLEGEKQVKDTETNELKAEEKYGPEELEPEKFEELPSDKLVLDGIQSANGSLDNISSQQYDKSLVGYRTIVTTEISKIPQTVVEKVNTLSTTKVYNYEKNETEDPITTEEPIEQDDDQDFKKIKCEIKGNYDCPIDEEQHERIEEDYHKKLDLIPLDESVGDKEELNYLHKHLSQKVTNKKITKQIDIHRTIYIKIGEEEIYNTGNAIEKFIKSHPNLNKTELEAYLNEIGVPDENAREILSAYEQAEKDLDSDSGSSNGNSGGSSGGSSGGNIGGTTGGSPSGSTGGSTSGNPSGSTGGSTGGNPSGGTGDDSSNIGSNNTSTDKSGNEKMLAIGKEAHDQLVKNKYTVVSRTAKLNDTKVASTTNTKLADNTSSQSRIPKIGESDTVTSAEGYISWCIRWYENRKDISKTYSKDERISKCFSFEQLANGSVFEKLNYKKVNMSKVKSGDIIVGSEKVSMYVGKQSSGEYVIYGANNNTQLKYNNILLGDLSEYTTAWRAPATEDEIEGISTGGSGSEIVNEAVKYIGNPYVWGGNSLTNGCDCSHFVYLIYNKCGYPMGYVTTYYYQSTYGKYYVGNTENVAKAGDAVTFGPSSDIHHVGIYDGKGMIVEAKGRAYGITHDRSINHGDPIAGIYHLVAMGKSK